MKDFHKLLEAIMASDYDRVENIIAEENWVFPDKVSKLLNWFLMVPFYDRVSADQWIQSTQNAISRCMVCAISGQCWLCMLKKMRIAVQKLILESFECGALSISHFYPYLFPDWDLTSMPCFVGVAKLFFWDSRYEVVVSQLRSCQARVAKLTFLSIAILRKDEVMMALLLKHMHRLGVVVHDVDIYLCIKRSARCFSIMCQSGAMKNNYVLDTGLRRIGVKKDEMLVLKTTHARNIAISSMRGLSSDDLRAMQRDDKADCCVCYSEYQPNQEVCFLQCGHTVCFKCMSAIANHSQHVCPLCRQDSAKFKFGPEVRKHLPGGEKPLWA